MAEVRILGIVRLEPGILEYKPHPEFLQMSMPGKNFHSRTLATSPAVPKDHEARQMERHTRTQPLNAAACARQGRSLLT